MSKLRWTEYDIKNPSKATSEWMEAHRGADEVVIDRNGNPWKAIYLSPITQVQALIKEQP